MTFPSRPEYERLVYGLLNAYPEVVGSTLYLYSTSALTAIVEGRVTLRNGLVLHEPPDIKRNRKPAPGISFTAPNLPTLIADCIALGASPVAGLSAENDRDI